MRCASFAVPPLFPSFQRGPTSGHSFPLPSPSRMVGLHHPPSPISACFSVVPSLPFLSARCPKAFLILTKEFPLFFGSGLGWSVRPFPLPPPRVITDARGPFFFPARMNRRLCPFHPPCISPFHSAPSFLPPRCYTQHSDRLSFPQPWALKGGPAIVSFSISLLPSPSFFFRI